MLKKTITIFIIWVMFLLGLCSLLPFTVYSAVKNVTIATYSDLRYKFINEQIKPFIEGRHKDIKVKVEYYPWAQYWTKLYTMQASGLAPDIIDTAGTYFFEFVLADSFVKLDDLIARDLHMEDYFAPPWLEPRYPYRKGAIYGVPYMWVVSLLYYNKDAFDAGGLNYPDESWDWNTLLSAARKLTRDTSGDGKIDQWGFGTAVDPYTHYVLFHSLTWSFGGEILNQERTRANLEHPGTRNALQFIADMILKYRIAPPPGVASSVHQGNAAMGVGGSWNINYIFRNIEAFDWDIAMLPKGPVARGIEGHSNFWCIMRRPNQDIEAVWAVMKDLISEKGMQIYLGGWVPVLRSVALSEQWLERKLRPQNKMAMIRSAPLMRDADFTPNWSQWDVEMRKELDLALQGKRSVEASLSAASAAIDRILQKAYKYWR